MDALLVLIMATLERVFGRKKEKHRLTDEIYFDLSSKVFNNAAR